jgi:predicted nucleic-acid-binding Zn-ribbon protein
MPLYVGKKFEATHTGGFVLDFKCNKCGHESEAAVRARGYAQAHSPFGLDGDAESNAHEDAWAASARNARSTIRFATCPKCGNKNRSGLMLFLLGTFIKLLLAAGILFFFAGYFLSERETTMGIFFILGGLALMIGLYWAYFHPRWAKADQRVIFMDPEE